MIITEDMLTLFKACPDAKQEFAERFPDGLDVGGLWLDYDARAKTWRRILSDKFLRRYVGWAIGEGLLPARIIGDFSDADLIHAVLRGAVLSDADLSRADLSGAVLSGADLSGADLSGAVLSGADLSGADLRGAILRGAVLIHAVLNGADLSGADLRGAILRGADLSRADLNGADLRGADLRGADLSRADLRRADLSRADLRGTMVCNHTTGIDLEISGLVKTDD